MTGSLFARDHQIRLDCEQDVFALMSVPGPGLVFGQDDLAPEFFDLRNGLAGAILQKLINYQLAAAIVVAPEHGLGERATQLLAEHARHPLVRAFDNEQAACQWLQERVRA